MTDALARIAQEQVDLSFTRAQMTVSDPDTDGRTHNGICDERFTSLIGSPADHIADFLLRVCDMQEEHVRKQWVAGLISYDVERALSERLHATRRVIHYYKVAVSAVDDHEYGTPDAESLPGLVLAMAIAADSHPRAPGYSAIAPYTYMILEDYL